MNLARLLRWEIKYRFGPYSKEQHMASDCEKYCLEAIQHSETLIQLAHDGNSACDDDRCLVLFGIILDSASRIKTESQKRLKALKAETTRHERLRMPDNRAP